MSNVHGQEQRTIGAGEFKQHCLALLDEVADSGVLLIVTKRGRPVARVSPVEAPSPPMVGSVRVLTDNEEELFSTGEAWDAEQAE